MVVERKSTMQSEISKVLVSAQRIIFRPAGAWSIHAWTHGWRRGLILSPLRGWWSGVALGL